MTIVTHVLVTTVLVRALGLHGHEAVLAYAFGVGPDVDHALKAPFYLRTIGLKNRKGYYWRSSLQEPVALLWIAPLCLALGTPLPLLFFLLHVALDYSVGYEKMPLYPYSPVVVRGWLTGLSDRVKEGFVLIVTCISLLLLLVRR